MKWYAAHIVMQVQFKTDTQMTFPVWENIYLIESESVEEALTKAESIGVANEGDNGGSFFWEEMPARWVYKGVRKLQTLSHPSDPGNKPTDGCELTFTTYEFASPGDLDRFVEGEEVVAKILD
jgi:hypothetical protein